MKTPKKFWEDKFNEPPQSNDEKLAVVMMAEYAEYILNFWTKEKPNIPCVFVTRSWNNNLNLYDYNIWRLEKDASGSYLAWLTEQGDEWDDYSLCNFDGYKIIEKL